MACVTHHHACDCREAAHAAEIARLREVIRAAHDDLTSGDESGAEAILRAAVEAMPR